MPKYKEFHLTHEEGVMLENLFSQDIYDFNIISNALKLNNERRFDFYVFLMDRGYIDINLNIDPFDGDTSFIPKEKIRDLWYELPIDFRDDYFEEEWYFWAYGEMRKYLEEICQKNDDCENVKFYDLDDVIDCIGMIYSPLAHSPKNLYKTILNSVCKNLNLISKNEKYKSKDILYAFDKAFENVLYNK